MRVHSQPPRFACCCFRINTYLTYSGRSRTQHTTVMHEYDTPEDERRRAKFGNGSVRVRTHTAQRRCRRPYVRARACNVHGGVYLYPTKKSSATFHVTCSNPVQHGLHTAPTFFFPTQDISMAVAGFIFHTPSQITNKLEDV